MFLVDFLWWPKKWVFRVHYKDVNLSALVNISYVLVCPFPHKIQTINGSKDIVRNSCYSSHIHQFGSQNRVTAQGSRFRQRKILNIKRSCCNNLHRGQHCTTRQQHHERIILLFTTCISYNPNNVFHDCFDVEIDYTCFDPWK